MEERSCENPSVIGNC